MIYGQRRPLIADRGAASPVVYCLWISTPLYLGGRWPVYVGSADDVRRRVGEHRRTFADTPDIGDEAVSITYLYAADLGTALWAESVLLHHLRPVVNIVLPGAGSREQEERTVRAETLLHVRPWVHLQPLHTDRLEALLPPLPGLSRVGRPRCRRLPGAIPTRAVAASIKIAWHHV